MYITGPSGSGKTSLLPLAIDRVEKPNTLATPAADKSRPCMEAFPCSPEKATRILAGVGLADAFCWPRLFSELSDGQQARFEIASLLASPGHTVVLDNFCNGLDRMTARAVAWTTSKACRRAARTLIVVTPHDDLAADLQPDLILTVNWSGQTLVDWQDAFTVESPLIGEMTYSRGSLQDYNQLAPLHYAADAPATVHSYHVLRHPNLVHPAAVAVLSFPDLHSGARNLATEDAYRIGGSRQQAMRLNREVLKLSRIITAPEVRCVSLSQALIGSLLPTLNIRYLECVTTMGRYSPFLTRIGFREIPQSCHPTEASLLDWANVNLKDGDSLLDPDAFARMLSSLSVREARTVRRLVWKYFHHFVLHRRTRKPLPKVIPGPLDPRWTEAFEIASKRCLDRPAYFILGPLEQGPNSSPGFPVCHQQLPPSDRLDFDDSQRSPSDHRPTAVRPAQSPHGPGTDTEVAFLVADSPPKNGVCAHTEPA